MMLQTLLRKYGSATKAADESSGGLFVASDVALGGMLSSHRELTFGISWVEGSCGLRNR